MDVDNKVLFSGSTYQPGILTGLTQMDIEGSLSDASNPLTQAIVGVANYLTASICTGTGGMPATVCASKGEKSASSALRSIAPSGRPRGMCPRSPVRGVAQAARRRACLLLASTPNVPLWRVGELELIFVLSRSSVFAGLRLVLRARQRSPNTPGRYG